MKIRLVEDGVVLWSGTHFVEGDLVRWMDMFFLFEGMDGEVRVFGKVECETL